MRHQSPRMLFGSYRLHLMSRYMYACVCGCRTSYLIESLLHFYNRQEPPTKGRYCRRRLLLVSYAVVALSEWDQEVIKFYWAHTHTAYVCARISAAVPAACCCCCCCCCCSNKHTTLTLDNAASRQPILSPGLHRSSRRHDCSWSRVARPVPGRRKLYTASRRQGRPILRHPRQRKMRDTNPRGTKMRKFGTKFKFGQLILGNIIKIVATRCHILELKCTKFDFGCPRPRWGSSQRSLWPPIWI